jgi:hypothetical protein
MKNLEGWIYGLPPTSREPFKTLKNEVYTHAKRDYLFFPFLIGYVSRYLNEDTITDKVKNVVYQLLFELMIENKVTVSFVTESELKDARWASTNDVKKIIEEVKTQ